MNREGPVVLVDGEGVPVPEPLGKLIGFARARILILLDTPRSTSDLVALGGQALGSVGNHLKVLRDACLVERQRVGRSVLYRRTDVGEIIVKASER
ncbi:ArsR family transcriptional regulator [Streptomyces griseoviridis]|uniref:ArsR family transcriptional regulator n=1 Tax=Streptomyces griseoviridis TaxID=45398 RepID=A0A3S9ZNZ4_STRGD|nr:ArsR family transcriptional regulator [Streptomyces griseoviridis]QCN83566.1 hypothetical protein DDJ31_00095 [Streptomyces griseoviridis]